MGLAIKEAFPPPRGQRPLASGVLMRPPGRGRMEGCLFKALHLGPTSRLLRNFLGRSWGAPVPRSFLAAGDLDLHTLPLPG